MKEETDNQKRAKQIIHDVRLDYRGDYQSKEAFDRIFIRRVSEALDEAELRGKPASSIPEKKESGSIDADGTVTP